MQRAMLFVGAMALLITSGGFLTSQPPAIERKITPSGPRKQIFSTVTLEAKQGPVGRNLDLTPSYVYFTNHLLDGDPQFGSEGPQSKMNNFAGFRFTVVDGPSGKTLKTGSGMYHSNQKGICHEFGKYLGVMRAAAPADTPFYVFEEKNDPNMHWLFEATPNDIDSCCIFRQKGPTAQIELFQVAIRRPLVEN
jgi:hypothetical protein